MNTDGSVHMEASMTCSNCIVADIVLSMKPALFEQNTYVIGRITIIVYIFAHVKLIDFCIKE